MALVCHEKASRTALQTSSVLHRHTLLVQTHNMTTVQEIAEQCRLRCSTILFVSWETSTLSYDYKVLHCNWNFRKIKHNNRISFNNVGSCKFHIFNILNVEKKKSLKHFLKIGKSLLKKIMNTIGGNREMDKLYMTSSVKYNKKNKIFSS